MIINKIPFDVFVFEKATTNNGVPFYVKHLPWVPGWLEVRIMLHVGARHDPIGKEGLAHFFEHLPFQGCKGFPDYLAIKQVEDELFHGNLNANTNMDRTCFEGKVFKQKLPEALAFLRKLIFSPLFEEEQIEKERSVIIREIWDHIKNQKVANFYKKVMPCLYLSSHHPTGRMFGAAGWEESVRQISIPDLVNLHQTEYHRNNLSIVLVGDITLPEARECLEKFTQNLPAGKATKQARTDIRPWPAPLKTNFAVTFEEVGLPAPDYAALEIDRVISRVDLKNSIDIFDRMIRRELNIRIREELGAAYGANVESNNFADHLLWRTSLTTYPSSMQQVKALFLSTLREISNGKRGKEFESAKEKHLTNQLLIDMNVDEVADAAIRDLCLGDRITPLQEDLEQINTVTYEDIQTLVREELGPELLLWVDFYP